jgi:hypothetical protein
VAEDHGSGDRCAIRLLGQGLHPLDHALARRVSDVSATIVSAGAMSAVWTAESSRRAQCGSDAATPSSRGARRGAQRARSTRSGPRWSPRRQSSRTRRRCRSRPRPRSPAEAAVGHRPRRGSPPRRGRRRRGRG